MAETTLQHREQAIAGARASLVAALANARAELTPASLANRAKQSALAAIAPITDPLVQQTKSASGWLILAGSAAAMVFAAGRSSAPVPVIEVAARPDSEASAVPADAMKPPVPQPRDTKAGFKSVLNSAVLAGAGLAAGAFLASRFPLTEAEKQHGGAVGREIGHLAQNLVRTYSRTTLNGAVNSLGIARSAGTLLAILAAVSAAGTGGK